MTPRLRMTTHVPLSVALVLPLVLTTSCGGSTEPTLTRTTASIGVVDATVGALEEDGIQVLIPADAIEQEHTFSIEAAADHPSMDGRAGALVGTPYEVDVDSDVKRFDSPLTVSFRLTDQQWDSLEDPQNLQVGYYDGSVWEFLTPTVIDVGEHSVTFETYHCSLLSPVEPTDEEIREQVAHDIAVADVTVDKNAALRDVTESLVKSVMGERVDKSLLRDIVEGMLDQNDYTQLLKAAANGNVEEFQTQFIASYAQVTANTLWAYSSAFAGDLGDLGANLGLAGSFGSSAALIADGNYQAAAEELAKGIIQTNPMGKLLLTAANVTERQISRWKNAEIEAAYVIYLNGKEPTIPFWGYGSIEAGDFEQIWTEMRGVSRQILIDAVADFTAEQGRPPSDDERTRLEADAKATLLAEFENRKAREQDIAKAEAKNLEFLEIARDGNLLTWSRYGFDRGTMSYQERVRQILDLRNRVLVDTKRVLTFGGEDTDAEINAYTVSRLITTYVRDGEAAYDQLLIDEGFVERLDPAGSWTGTITWTGYQVPPLVENQPRCTSSEGLPLTVELTMTLQDLGDGRYFARYYRGGVSCWAYEPDDPIHDSYWESPGPLDPDGKPINDAGEYGLEMTLDGTTLTGTDPLGVTFTGSVSPGGTTIGGSISRSSTNGGVLSGSWTVTPAAGS